MSAAIRVYAPERTPETPYRWQDDAACAQVDPDMFFPDSGDYVMSRKAREFCAGCPVIKQCRELGEEFEFGVFGGTTPKERREAKGPWRGSKERQLELAKKGVPVPEIARLCQVTERTVQRTITG